ncbi:imidazoleglycerol-phosphate dehydratase [Clostridium pasteurianum DSM 525 = ATCC 6013]|uniref:Imidazoleglycerol-phosphate dehydratase n=1 Tax=Clostridium pasteurianum DSM 525 = ATCC 6013 TaxID=1262449 RepID=A0A0H3JA86_CLOPA|nr:imidazoleglycerol-phosphate dehydratase HisB [Clostridium pasteurianum]AJA49333.1 imidazoleglycerol-phosphate dehydratase [Clostridium pasteurianum DSM 525 = ATCC 6013]AJA53321.1 imidazoleglycerol-phosphate dehydratase [Clostridium pasteurianum DSM 525 = ATCC 6013]AOZ76508.1 imidazoleglycerol-phosphate dehydratase [Clostridium pasteurianum DSM 525 = ATCC 6013]AOZ80305.1 imidazoleglycerol-phosphate dehydratase [Clostridium pasteurianum]ELP58353.1 imidazoleglycerol-phosphate dehydratase [Clos
MDKREASISRKTMETNIDMSLELDGEGNSSIETGVGFFDHMLTLMTKHGLMTLNLKAEGDIYVDSHHLVEDVGIVLGKCINKALGDKVGIKRYGTAYVPMDESLSLVSIDISGRPYLVFEGDFSTEKLGMFETEMVEEFFRAVAFNAGITLHVKSLYGKNTHHIIEGMFKAFGRALKEAMEKDFRIKGVMSTKGSL